MVGHPRRRSACPGIAPSGLSRGAALAGGVREEPSEGAVGPGRPAGPPRAGSTGPGDPRREPGRAPRGASEGVLSGARPSGGAGAGLGALRCPGRAGRPSPGLLCVERRGGSARVGRDAHKLVGPRRRVRTQTKDGLCLGGARREEGAVTPGPDSGRESGVGSGGRGAAGGLGSTPPLREGAGSAGAAGAGTARGDRTPSGRASDISPESSSGAPRLHPLGPGGPGSLRLLGGLSVKFEGRVSLFSPFPVLFVSEGFPSSSRVIVAPLPPAHPKVGATGSLFEKWEE